jgi:hypothetical protein
MFVFDVNSYFERRMVLGISHINLEGGGYETS